MFITLLPHRYILAVSPGVRSHQLLHKTIPFKQARFLPSLLIFMLSENNNSIIVVEIFREGSWQGEII